MSIQHSALTRGVCSRNLAQGECFCSGLVLATDLDFDSDLMNKVVVARAGRRVCSGGCCCCCSESIVIGFGFGGRGALRLVRLTLVLRLVEHNELDAVRPSLAVFEV